MYPQTKRPSSVPRCPEGNWVLGSDPTNPTAEPQYNLLGWEVIRDGVQELTGVADCAAVRATILAFARWVGNLPASEKHHHSQLFGLVHHSIMVTQRFLDRLRRTPSNQRGLEHLASSERRNWIMAGMAAALLHDCGKAFDMEVTLSPSGITWDPMKEPLTRFLRRYCSKPMSDLFYIKFLPGRGLKGHEAKGRALLPVILPSSFAGDLLTKTLAIYDAYVSHHELKDPKAHWPAAWFAAIIITADRADCAGRLELQTEW